MSACLWPVRILIILLVMIFVTTEVRGQASSALYGTVRDENNEPIPFAVVSIPEISLHAVADDGGVYRLEPIPAGTHVLVLKSVGFNTLSLTLELSASERMHRDIILSESVAQLDAVTVHGKTALTETTEQPYSVTAIATKKFVNRAADMHHILGQSTGVRIREQGGLGSRFEFSLNGLSGRQVKFFMDGIPMEYLGDAFQLNNLPVNLVKQVEVYKGVVPVDLGSDALGGAVNIVTDLYADPFLDVSYSFGSFGTHRAALSSLSRRASSGMLLRFNAYFNRSDNNYVMHDMEIYDYGQQRYVEKDIRRFHDGYKSHMAQVEAGFQGKKWADFLLLGITTAGLNKDVQHGIFGTPVGEARVKEANQQLSLRYAVTKLLDGKLDGRLHAQYNLLNSVSTDTSSNRYDWSGSVVRTADDALGELVRQKTVFDYDQSLLLVNAGITYAIHPLHKMKVNAVGSQLSRQGENRLRRGEVAPFTNPNTLGKIVTGIAVESNWLQDRLTSIASFKHYGFDMLTRNAVLDQAGKSQIEDVATRESSFGYAAGGRYFITTDWLIKTSLEKSFRLPEAKESLGDGYRIIAAPFLKPESSLNFNTGFQYKKNFQKSRLVVESNYFNRHVDNWIFLQSQGMVSQHVNIMKVLVRGAELDARYTYNDKLGVFANATYQDVLNNDKYVAGTQSKTENRFYRDRLSNTPYLFGNTGLDYRFKTFANGVELSAYYSANYVHGFYLVYSRASQSNTKNRIPTQFINNAGVTLSSEDNRYNVTLEARNFLDALAYDNFRMQKPGRSFNVKIRYFLQ